MKFAEQLQQAYGSVHDYPVIAPGVALPQADLQGEERAKVRESLGFTKEQVQEMVGALVTRLEQEPDNAEGWSMLARTYLVLQDYPKAAAAYARLDKLTPNNPDVLSDWADVTAATRGTMVGEAEALAKRMDDGAAGGEAAARCHLARTIVRRAERETVTLARHQAVRSEALQYLNRLSDLLFVLARVLARADGQGEALWQPQQRQR